MNKEKKKISIVRGPRFTNVYFYEKFTKFNINYLATGFTKFNYNSKNDNFKFKYLPLNYPLGFDPANIVNNFGNLSITSIKGLENELRGSDIINITDTYYFINLQTVNWAKKNGVPVVTIIWCTIPNHITTWFPPYSYITKKVIEATDLFILRSNTVLEFTDSINIPRSKVKVIHKGIDLKMFKPGVSKNIKKSVNILFTGNLTKSKGLDDLLEVFVKIYKNNKKIKLTIAGEGELEDKIIEFSKHYPINFKGFVKYAKMPDLYKDADILCIPSKERKILGVKLTGEYFPYVAMEGLALGLPILASDLGGIPEAIGKNNLLFTPGNVEDLKKALLKLIKDKELRKSLEIKNRKRAEKLFDINKQSKKTEEAIIDIL